MKYMTIVDAMKSALSVMWYSLLRALCVRCRGAISGPLA